MLRPILINRRIPFRNVLCGQLRLIVFGNNAACFLESVDSGGLNACALHGVDHHFFNFIFGGGAVHQQSLA